MIFTQPDIKTSEICARIDWARCLDALKRPQAVLSGSGKCAEVPCIPAAAIRPGAGHSSELWERGLS